MVIGVKHKSTPYIRTNRRNSNLKIIRPTTNKIKLQLVVVRLWMRIAYLEYLTIGAHIFKYRPSSLAVWNRSAMFVFGLTYIFVRKLKEKCSYSSKIIKYNIITNNYLHSFQFKINFMLWNWQIKFKLQEFCYFLLRM